MDDSRFKLSQHVVEATSYEVLKIIEQCDRDNVLWKQDFEGRVINVGSLNEYPIVMYIQWYTINYQLVLFWESTSRVVDYVMIEDWLDDHCNVSSKTNAMNFNP